MILTGPQIVDLGIVPIGLKIKVDDGIVPSYGNDPAAYTFRPAQIDDRNRIVLSPLQTLVLKTFEHVHMPLSFVGMLWIKSTYARKGIILVTNSMVDPGYQGQLTMRLFNSDSDPHVINMPGMQVLEPLLSRIKPT